MEKLPPVGPYSQSKENSGTGKEEKKNTKMGEAATKSLPNLDTSDTKSLRVRQIQTGEKFDPTTKQGHLPELKKAPNTSKSPPADLNFEKNTRRVRESSFKENPLTPRVDDSWLTKNKETYNKGINALARNQQIPEKEQTAFNDPHLKQGEAALPKIGLPPSNASKKGSTENKFDTIPPSPPARDETPSTMSISSSSSSETLPKLSNTPPPPPLLGGTKKK